jgi:ribulose-phosphate 3-epimerase
VVADLDLLLIMSVNPGWSGQQYIPASTAKIQRARALLDRNGSPARLEVDGGIGRATIGEAFAAGADTFAAGSSVFGGRDPAAEVRELRRLCSVTV